LQTYRMFRFTQWVPGTPECQPVRRISDWWHRYSASSCTHSHRNSHALSVYVGHAHQHFIFVSKVLSRNLSLRNGVSFSSICISHIGIWQPKRFLSYITKLRLSVTVVIWRCCSCRRSCCRWGSRPSSFGMRESFRPF